MTLVRHIALLLALTVATVAASLAPSPAQAHDGHRHAAASTGTHASRSTVSHVRPVRVVPARIEAARDCTAPCCAGGHHHGSCCCATGLAPEAAFPGLPVSPSAHAPAVAHASPDGIVPEALPEPPRPFA